MDKAGQSALDDTSLVGDRFGIFEALGKILVPGKQTVKCVGLNQIVPHVSCFPCFSPCHCRRQPCCAHSALLDSRKKVKTVTNIRSTSWARNPVQFASPAPLGENGHVTPPQDGPARKRVYSCKMPLQASAGLRKRKRKNSSKQASVAKFHAIVLHVRQPPRFRKKSMA